MAQQEPYEKHPLPNQLREIRVMRNLTADQLADMVGVTPSTLTAWEEGTEEPDVFSKARLSRVLRVKAWAIFESEEESSKRMQQLLNGED